MNNTVKTPFILSIIANGSLTFYCFLALLERFYHFGGLATTALISFFLIVSFVIAPLVLSIVSLSMLRRVGPVVGKDRLFVILTRVFSWLVIGGFAFALTIVLLLVLIFGAIIF